MNFLCRLGCLLVVCICAFNPSFARASTAAELRDDLDVLEAGIAATHPQLSHSVDPQRLHAAIESLRLRAHDACDQDCAWRLFATLDPLMADGHLSVGYEHWREDTRRHLASGGRLFPFEVAVGPDDSLRIVSALGGGATAWAGRTITRIGRLPAREVVHTLLSRVHGDSPRFRAALLSQRWWLYHWKMSGAPAAFDLTMAGSPAMRIRVPGSVTEPLAIAGEQAFDRQFRFELRPGGAAVLTLRTFAWSRPQEFLDFTREAFQRLQATTTHTLVIDVRENGGGDDALWLEGLLPHLADKPYRWGSRYVKKVLKDDPSRGERAGEVVSGEITGWASPPPDDPLQFRGRVIVLVGAATYSSAVLFANTMQDFGFATLAGVGNSVRSMQSGGVQKIRLPNTGLVLWSPRFVLTRPSGETSPRWLTPDLLLQDDPLEPGAMVDEVLHATH